MPPILVSATNLEFANGNPEVFDAEWQDALRSGDSRWLSYPTDPPKTQVDLFELVKSHQIDTILRKYSFQSGCVLEYACGSAGMGVYFANKGFQVVASDISLNGLNLACRNAQYHQAQKNLFSSAGANVYHLPFPEASFDIVMSYGLLEHFTAKQLVPVLSETNRVLRPGGLHIVDIIHGRPSIRTVANLMNFTASSIVKIARGQISEVTRLHQAYFSKLFENSLTPAEWRQLLVGSGLEDVVVLTCRPFPLLAIGGFSERVYIEALKILLPLWRWFDRTDLPILNNLGWMYLAYGIKQAKK